MNRTLLVILGYALIAGTQQPAEPSYPTTPQQMFANALKFAGMVSNASRREHAIFEIAKAQARSGFYSEAVSTTKLAGSLREMVLVDVASIAANGGEYEPAVNAV